MDDVQYSFFSFKNIEGIAEITLQLGAIDVLPKVLGSISSTHGGSQLFVAPVPEYKVHSSGTTSTIHTCGTEICMQKRNT